MTEDKLPYSSSPEPETTQDHLEPPLQPQIQEAVIITQENETVNRTVDYASVPESEPTTVIIEQGDQTEEILTKAKLHRTNVTLNSLNIRQLDEELEVEEDQEQVAQNTDWFTLARKLRQHNRELVKTVVQLEQALADTQEALQTQMMRCKSADLLINQQTEELNNTQKQVSRLFNELEASHKTAQRQQSLLDHLTQQLQEAQEQTAKLERECALLQESYNEQSLQLMETEKQIRELNARLHDQQRQNLEYKSSLEQFASVSAQVQTPSPSKLSPKDIKDLKEQSLELDSAIQEKIKSPQINTTEVKSSIPPQEEPTLAFKIHHHQPIQPWSSQSSETPFPVRPPISDETNKENLNPSSQAYPVKATGLNAVSAKPSLSEPQFFNPKKQTPPTELPTEGIILPFPEKNQSQSSSFPSFTIKSSSYQSKSQPKSEEILPHKDLLETEKIEPLLVNSSSELKHHDLTLMDEESKGTTVEAQEIPENTALNLVTNQDEQIEKVEPEIEALNEEKTEEITQVLSPWGEAEEKEVSPVSQTETIPAFNPEKLILPKKDRSQILLPLEFPRKTFKTPSFTTKIQLQDSKKIDDLRSNMNQSLGESESNFAPSSEAEKPTKNFPSPLIRPLRSPKTKKPLRQINLPNFNQYHSV